MLKNDKIRQFEFYNEISVCLEQCSQKIIEIYESFDENVEYKDCLLYTSPSPRDSFRSRMPSSA